MHEPARIAFIKFGGLASAGTERWLQMMAANLPRDRFAVDYFYCDSAPYIGSDFNHPDTDPNRIEYMERAGVNLVKFRVGAKDVRTPTHEWVDTDFWDVFDPRAYDLVQTAKAGPAEYPYYLMDLPVIEYVTLSAGVDRSRNLVFSIHLSQWQRRRWAAAGGDLRRSGVIPIPVEPPTSTLDLRDQHGILPESRVAGFHQRPQDEIFSPIPLAAFELVSRRDRYFVIMGGGPSYRKQAAEMRLQNVIFLEPHASADRISRFLNTLDVFAHGRRDGETFGTVLAEAMMHGKPCLSHWSPVANAQPETMGPAGLFAAGAEDYAEKLERLFSDGDLYRRLAGKARAHAEHYYSLNSCVVRLADVYESVLDGPSPGTERPIPYGQSDLGFLVAGAVDNPRSVAHHVVSGEIPDEAVAHLLRHVLPAGSIYHEVGSANTILALAAAHDAEGPGETFLHVAPGAEFQAVRASIGLNNWEERLFLNPVGSPTEVPADKLRTADFVTVNSSEWSERVVPRLALDEWPDRPALLLNLAGERAVEVPARLEALGYQCRRVRERSFVSSSRVAGRRPGWFLCLHPLHHGAILAGLPVWGRQRRRTRRRRMRALPSRALRHCATAAGSLAYRLRRALPF